ncbi:glycosyltransferase family 69 protein [Amniculicola lignicola CBS 123094]|uniref:Glycosyltransferase family 69 protein n=1 Tax=Amniculicola lignicola CBS 123094 TaxID=1392246 RepID=A0A6A5X3S0_9PLEO|nr:glycosyltransferase family 69 protein [Amniculicola lignicola CBS 123094]
MNRNVRSLLHAIVLLTGVALVLLNFGYFHYGYGTSKTSLIPHGLPSYFSPHNHTPSNPSPNFELTAGNPHFLAQTASYIRAISNSSDTTFPRLECPFSPTDRYTYMNKPSESAAPKPKYFFALDLHNCVKLLPRLIGSIVETIRFLGPRNCALSVVEGRSVDGTFEVLKELRNELEGLGIRYIFQSSDINPHAKGTDRIEALAELRNLAIKDILENSALYAQDTTIIFSNDIAVCMEDILELIHQRNAQSADMTCAMDWTYVGENPTFYDVWIARGMTGDSFFNIPPDGSWDYAWNLFWNDAKAQSHWQSFKPFQVFSCWNGITAFTAKPIMEGKIRFRKHLEKECYQGEPKLFAKDMWWNGYGKIAVVPSVNVEYSDEAAKKIKTLKGYTWSHVANEEDNMKIKWELDPPSRVKCIPGGYETQKWVAWNEGLP